MLPVQFAVKLLHKLVGADQVTPSERSSVLHHMAAADISCMYTDKASHKLLVPADRDALTRICNMLYISGYSCSSSADALHHM